MSRKVLILVGTKKGAFIIESDTERKSWQLRGPHCDTWPINHMKADPVSKTIYAGGGNEWFGPAVWKSTDLGNSWSHSSEGLAYEPGGEPVGTVWSLSPAHGVLYAGVQPAGLFCSDDEGVSWRHLAGLQRHPSRAEWQPGGAGLILHSIVNHPQDEQQIWVGMSAVGVFHTGDGGDNWEPRNQGTRQDYAPEGQRYPEFGQCVHSIVMAAGQPDQLYQQNHCGMYRSEDGGRTWVSIEAGLPSSFGFPSVGHPRDPDTLYLVPLNGDSVGRFMPEGKAAVWRTRDGGKSWSALRNGLPQQDVYFGVLRQAMATDPLDPCGIYFGSSSGTVYASSDEGESWEAIADHLPVISSVETMIVDA